MLKRVLAILITFGACSSGFGFANARDWIGTMGLGLTLNPSSFLWAPQLEYAYENNLLLGTMLQFAPGQGDVLIAVSATARTLVGRHPRVKPSLEVGLGFATESTLGSSSSFGLNINYGLGFDYLINDSFSLGTMIQGNFAPPLRTFYLSWPILVARLVL